MGSMTYWMANAPSFLRIQDVINTQNQEIIAAQTAGQPKPKWHGPTQKTLKQYRDHAIKFGKWCKEV